MSDRREDSIRASWLDNAAAWTAAVRGRHIESRVRVTDAAVLTAIAECGARRVLDVGCGEGWLCRALHAAGISATGFDATPKLIEQARQAGPGEYHVLGYDGFAREPAAVGTGFDAVVCNFSLLGEDIIPVLRAAGETLRHGGALIIQTVHPFADSPEGVRYEDGWRVEDFEDFAPGFTTPMPWYFRTVASWIAALREAGCVLESCREPVHPDTRRPLSLLLIGRKQ